MLVRERILDNCLVLYFLCLDARKVTKKDQGFMRSHLKMLFVKIKVGCHSERVEEYSIGNSFTLRQAQGDILLKD